VKVTAAFSSSSKLSVLNRTGFSAEARNRNRSVSVRVTTEAEISVVIRLSSICKKTGR
jgi:hypothetical protein